MRKYFNKNVFTLFLLLGIFIVALTVRFAYFPKNIYFSYDQARDFFFADDILKGDIRLIGPPSAASDKLFPGPFSLYIYSLIQLIFGKDPGIYSIFFRSYNALGLIPVFLIGTILFDKKVGLLSAGLYAFSYEQSQYALLMSHQPLAILPVLLFYLGLTLLFFKKEPKGLVLAAFGLGLAIQFHYVYIFLIPICFALLFLLRKEIPKMRLSNLINSIFIFFLMVSTYIFSEFKFHFGVFSEVLSNTNKSHLHIKEALYSGNRFIHDTFISNYKYTNYIFVLVLLIFVYLILKPKFKWKGIFLLLWFAGAILPYLISGTKGYYYSAAGSVSLLIMFSFVITKISRKSLMVGMALYLLVILNNYLLIKHQNPKGPNLEIVIQPDMLLPNETSALDYIYQSAGGGRFSVNALTVPLNVNTTWCYLFEWYGNKKYGYLPIWATKPAEGFPGNLIYESGRSKLPEIQYVIAEPLNGIPVSEINKFKATEGYFSEIIEEKKFGDIVVQKRRKI